MKIVTLTEAEEAVIAKMRRDALKAKAEPDAAAREVVRAENTEVVHCRASSAAGEKLGASQPWKQGERVEFMWMPAGVSTICAGFRKGSIELTVQCDEATAQAVQASLDAWREDRPKQEPFGCIEHREQEASFRVSARGGFKWNGDGVYLAAEPTTLGAENVNGRVHRSWSPSFTTDADYSKAKESDGVLQFPEGVRGSRSNPASITGVDFCVGTLTNKPAFHSMNPVRAKEGEKVAAMQGDASAEMAKPVTKEETSGDNDEQWRRELVQDVPDYTDAELGFYIDRMKEGRSRMACVTMIRSARYLESNEDKTKKVTGDLLINHAASAVPTLDSIYSKHADDMSRVNALAVKHCAVALTAQDVFERHCVMTGVKVIKTSDQTPAAILERIYARAGGNR